MTDFSANASKQPQQTFTDSLTEMLRFVLGRVLISSSETKIPNFAIWKWELLELLSNLVYGIQAAFSVDWVIPPLNKCTNE